MAHLNKAQRQAFLNGLDGVLAAERGIIKCEAVDMVRLCEASEEMLKECPTDRYALLQRGKARAFLGELDGALQDLEHCEDNAERAMQLAQCLSYMGRGMTPDRAKAEEIKLQGNHLFMDRDFKGAAELYLKALQFDPTNFKVLNNLASCHVNLNDHSTAVHFSGRSAWHSVQQGTPFSKAYIRQGDCLSFLKQFKTACSPYRSALRLLRRQPPALLNPHAERERDVGNGLYGRGDWAEAAAHYGLALGFEGGRSPTSAVLYANRAAAYLLKGLAKYSEGIGDAEAAMNLLPEYCMGYLRKADFLILKEDYEKAVEVLRLGIKICDR
eukprot:GGOE01001333.1.p1 GENE.GGOE01001333.1~~GGOE01001333.1.p1  ORF type:complete len:348 (+),score=99.31 GGOE01001333.1:64-1044(+)